MAQIVRQSRESAWPRVVLRQLRSGLNRQESDYGSASAYSACQESEAETVPEMRDSRPSPGALQSLPQEAEDVLESDSERVFGSWTEARSCDAGAVVQRAIRSM